MPRLTIIRGLPGTGKTTLAKQYQALHLEADMFFIKDSHYQIDLNRVRAAHDWCVKSAETALSNGMDVVISNTLVKKWEIQRYVDLANQYGASYEIIEASGKFKSTHDVPAEVIDRMSKQWEPYDKSTNTKAGN